MRNIYGILILLTILLSANLPSCSCLREHSHQEILPGENTPSSSPIYNDSLDKIFKEPDKVRVYETHNFINSHDSTVLGECLFIMNYELTKNMSVVGYLKALMGLVVCVAFMSMVGLLAAFIGPNHGVEIKILIGMTIGAMILGPRLPRALRALYYANYEVLKKIFRS